jgi:hypothetical protein
VLSSSHFVLASVISGHSRRRDHGALLLVFYRVAKLE